MPTGDFYQYPYMSNLPYQYQGQTTRCECHECTQARYKMSIQYQFDSAMNHSQQARPPAAKEE
jgi:hypothetical protein